MINIKLEHINIIKEQRFGHANKKEMWNEMDQLVMDLLEIETEELDTVIFAKEDGVFKITKIILKETTLIL